jgi:hypothetical protein
MTTQQYLNTIWLGLLVIRNIQLLKYKMWDFQYIIRKLMTIIIKALCIKTRNEGRTWEILLLLYTHIPSAPGGYGSDVP